MSDLDAIIKIAEISMWVVGFLLIWYGAGQFSSLDGRTKTGYKGNVVGKPGKGCLLIIIGVILIGVGFVGMPE